MNIHTIAHSTRRRSFNAKAIFGLLLAVVMVGAFATAGSAETTATPRSGELHVTKECHAYSGLPGGFCTITGSNLNAIDADMNVIYASGAAFPTLDSDLVLDGPGINDAYGHVTLNIPTFTGPVTFSGGTGRFSGFQASLWVTCTDNGLFCSWDGTYSFTPPGHDQ